MHRMEWDELRFFLAVAEAGSLAGAARALGVNHTTVLRRINGFEAQLGLRLFDRLPGGYAMTVGGEELLAAARRIEETVTGLERRLAGQDLRLEGELRVTTTDTLALTILMPHLAAFRTAHPGITLELTVTNAMANLTRRDADVAIRPTAEPPEALVGRRVAGLAHAIYAASRSYLERKAAEAPAAAADGIADLSGQAWIGTDASLASTVGARWLRRELPAARIVCRLDLLMAMRAAAAAGLGLALLPCYVGDTDPGLARVRPPLPGTEAGLWLLTHEDLRRTARVRMFTAFMARALEGERDLIEGRRPPAA